MGIDLDNFKQSPRPYQEEAIKRALAAEKGSSLLLASPTGTGKGTMQLALLQRLLERGDVAAIVTPSLEVLRGYLERCGATRDDLNCSASTLAKLGEGIGVWTPVRLRNRLVKSRVGCVPETIIVDEAHHATEDTISGGDLAALCQGATWLGFTATSYRGTPEETKALRARWGEPSVVLTIPEAIDNGSWALPSFAIKPLVDDDLCAIRAGDLNSDEVTLDAIGPLTDLCSTLDLSTPTCVTLNSVAAVDALRAELESRDVEVRTVLGDTSAEERAEAYELVKKGGTLLISCKVLGEGVDLPWLRNWVDASPTISPVAFMQKFGRITRPGPITPKYIGTNRNLERHGYLLQGALPREVIAMAQEAFGGPSERGARAGLLKCVAKTKPTPLPLAGGVKGTMWAFWTPAVRGGPGFEHVILLDPTSERVVSARHELTPAGATGRWDPTTRKPYERVPLPESMEGSSLARTKGPASVGQVGWWKKDALNYGLDERAVPTKAQFLALPVLKDLNESMGKSGVPVRKIAPPPERTVGDRLNELVAGAVTPALERMIAGEGKVGTSLPPRSERFGAFSPSPTSSEAVRSAGIAPHGAPERSPEGPAPVLRGYFTIVREDGGHRTYRLETKPLTSHFAPGKTIVVELLTGPDNTSSYRGVAFATSTGLHVWKRFADSGPDLRKDWAAIIGDPKGAGKRYAKESGNCWVCGRLLTTPESIAAGIGPVCAEAGA